MHVDLTRTLVLGCSGSGKSTFARALALRTGLPLIHLDQEYWQPGWVERYDTLGWCGRVTELAARPSWIIDGNYSGSLALRLPRATAILWLDVPRWQCLSGILWRIVTGYGGSRPDMAPGCREGFDPKFLHYAWVWHKRRRPQMLRRLMQPEYAPLLQVFNSRQAAQDWLARVTAGLIEP